MNDRASAGTTTERDRSRDTTERSGKRIVGVVYLVVVAIAGAMGYLLGAAGIRDIRPVELFFLIELQPTPLGLAIYGMATLGVGLGVALALVMYVSRRFAG